MSTGLIKIPPLAARYLGHETIRSSFGEPGFARDIFFWDKKSHAVDDSEIPNQTTTRFHQFYHSKKDESLHFFFKSYRARYIWFVPDLPSPHILMFFFRGNFHLWKLSPKRCMLHSPRAVFSKIKSQEGVFTNLWFFPQVLGCLWLEVRIARVRITGWKNLLINRSMLGLPTIDPTLLQHPIFG